jgi:serine/threonine-protein kinase
MLVQNGNRVGVRWAGSACGDAGGIFVDLSGSFDPGREWPGILGRFKKVSLGQPDLGGPTNAGYTEESRVGPLGNLAIALQYGGDYAQAEATLRETLAIDRKSYPPDSEWLNQDRGYLGNLLRLRHRNAEALEELRAAIAAVKGAGRGADPVVALLHAQLAEAELDAGDAAKAQATASRALELARAALPAHNIGLANALFALARAELALEHAAVAEPLLREALAVRSPLASHDPRVLEVKVALARAIEARGIGVEAVALRAELEPLLAASGSLYADDLRKRLAVR